MYNKLRMLVERRREQRVALPSVLDCGQHRPQLSFCLHAAINMSVKYRQSYSNNKPKSILLIKDVGIKKLRFILRWQENILFFFFLLLFIEETARISEDSVRISTFPSGRASGQSSCGCCASGYCCCHSSRCYCWHRIRKRGKESAEEKTAVLLIVASRHRVAGENIRIVRVLIMLSLSKRDGSNDTQNQGWWYD